MSSKKYKLPQVRIKMVQEGKSLYSDLPFDNPKVVGSVLAKGMRDLDREMIITVVLDARMRVNSFNIVAVGGTDTAPIAHISNLFKTAILSNGSYIIIAHNHPSGDITPSDPDINLTKTAIEAGRLLGIPVVDHIICGGEKYLSLNETTNLFEDSRLKVF